MENAINIINNNDYGASELKRIYNRSFREGLLIAVLIHIMAILIYIAINYINNAKADEYKKFIHRDSLKIVEIDIPPSIDDKETPKPNDEILKPIKDLSALDPKPVPKNFADDFLIKTQNQLDTMNYGVSRDGDSTVYFTNNNNFDNNTKIGNKIPRDITDNNKPFETYQVEKEPVCVNLAVIKNTINYPVLAREANIDGKVTVRVLVSESGGVLETGKLTGNELFYDEVKDKAMKLEFTPGLQNNKPVKVWVTVPFSFKLKN